jgi:hypothetical protein
MSLETTANRLMMGRWLVYLASRLWQLLGSPSGLRSFATGYFWKPYEGEVYKPLVTSSELKIKMSELLMAA